MICIFLYSIFVSQSFCVLDCNPSAPFPTDQTRQTEGSGRIPARSNWSVDKVVLEFSCGLFLIFLYSPYLNHLYFLHKWEKTTTLLIFGHGSRELLRQFVWMTFHNLIFGRVRVDDSRINSPQKSRRLCCTLRHNAHNGQEENAYRHTMKLKFVQYEYDNRKVKTSKEMKYELYSLNASV